MDDVLFHAVLKDPPVKYVEVRKKIKLDKDGKIKKDNVYYLTANVFYNGTHFIIRSKIVNFAKDWLLWNLKKIPPIEKCKLEIIYHHPTDTFDLDNKAYFWTKMILDLLKTPSSRQIINSQRYSNEIKSLGVLKDDTVRYVDEIKMKYVRGESALEIKLTGRAENKQGNLF